jgi:hypothetical protein
MLTSCGKLMRRRCLGYQEEDGEGEKFEELFVLTSTDDCDREVSPQTLA